MPLLNYTYKGCSSPRQPAAPLGASPQRAFTWSLLLVGLFLASCSRTPKELTISGFSDQCHAVDTPEVTAFCDCMVDKLNASIPAKVFNNPDTDQFILLNAFEAEVKRLTPECKASDSPSQETEKAHGLNAPVAEAQSNQAPRAAVDAEASQQVEPQPTTSSGSSTSNTQPSPEWVAQQQAIKADSQGFVRQCVAHNIQSAEELGGLSHEAAVQQAGSADSCKQLLVDLQNCMKLDPVASERCRDAFTQDQE